MAVDDEGRAYAWGNLFLYFLIYLFIFFYVSRKLGKHHWKKKSNPLVEWSSLAYLNDNFFFLWNVNFFGHLVNDRSLVNWCVVQVRLD